MADSYRLTVDRHLCAKLPVLTRAHTSEQRYDPRMLARSYIEALLADPERADEIWSAWSSGDISDEIAQRS
jgi:hypothetical protein